MDQRGLSRVQIVLILRFLQQIALRAHLVLPIVGSSSAQPDFVLPEVAGNIGDHLSHGNPLATSIISCQPGCSGGLQQQTQLLSQLPCKTCMQRLTKDESYYGDYHH